MCIFRCPLFPIHIKRIFAQNDPKPKESIVYINWRSSILNKTFQIPLSKLKLTHSVDKNRFNLTQFL